jgi:uncharacterized protein YkwD
MELVGLSRRSFVILGLGAGLSACTQYAPTTATSPTDVTPQQMVDAINGIRTKVGGSKLTYSPLLAQVARNQANAMVAHDALSHNFGQDLRTRASEVDYHGPIGENLAGGQRTLEQTLEGWMNSSGHRSTLLSSMWTSVGMVVANGKPGSRFGVFWAADFGVA